MAPRLSRNGLLVLGSHETAAAGADAFTPLTGRPEFCRHNPDFRVAA